MKPILFNTEMVHAILDGRKTVTRRVIKSKGWVITGRPKWGDKIILNSYWFDAENERAVMIISLHSPYSQGDILYVRETWTQDGDVFRYKAGFYDQNRKWKPSIHMPRKAARIFLRVTDVRVERLQDITALKIEKEGVRLYDDICRDENWHPSFYDPDSGGASSLVLGFSKLWDRTIKSADRALYGWDANPFVWVIEFEKISKEEAIEE